jgi:hypothetical protein
VQCIENTAGHQSRVLAVGASEWRLRVALDDAASVPMYSVVVSCLHDGERLYPADLERRVKRLAAPSVEALVRSIVNGQQKQFDFLLLDRVLSKVLRFFCTVMNGAMLKKLKKDMDIFKN